MKKIPVAVVLVVAIALLIASCTTGEQERVYIDAVEGRFGDALSLSGMTEDDGSITREVTFDTRLEGWHYLGIKAVAGRTLTFALTGDLATYGAEAIIDREGEAERFALIGDSVQYTPSSDGLVEVWLGACMGTDGGSLTVSGGLPASYYRYGVDDDATVADDGIIDGANVRIYLNGCGDSASDIAAVARWWRSAAELATRFTGSDFGVDHGVPVDIFLSDVAEIETDFDAGVVRVPYSFAADVCSYDDLTGGSAWSALRAVVDLVIYGSGFSDEAERWITALIYVLMTDNAAAGGGAPQGIGSGYGCLAATLEGVGDDEIADYAFANMLHSFGAECAAEMILDYRPSDSFADAFYTAAADAFGVDSSDYLALFGLTVSDDVLRDLPDYVPVQSSYTLGANADNATGTIVKTGESTAFDFSASVITTASEVSVQVVSDHQSRWSESGGIWYYTPSDGATEDDFVLRVTADGESFDLEGKLTYDICVGVQYVFEDVPYREIDDAVDGYEDIEPTHVFATDVAGVQQPAGEEDGSVYVFAVGKGSIQVPETAVYEIHLRSRGIVRVDFGVPKYMFTMFRNSLTIEQYYGELFYEVELEAGVVYDYYVYALSTKGSYFADLGIRKSGSDDPVVDIGKDYLICGGYDRSQVGGYEALDFKPAYFDVNPPVRVPLDGALISEISAPAGTEEGYAALLDDDPHTVYRVAEPSAEQEYSLDAASTRMDYFAFRCTIDGLDFCLYAGASRDDETLIATGKTRVGDNVVELGDGMSVGRLRLILSADEPFGDCVAGLEFGNTQPQCEVVPSDSSSVFYQGNWESLGGVIGTNGTIKRSYGRDAAVEYSFRGSYIAVYCAKGPQYGNMLVYLDGVLQTNVDLSSDRDEYGCLVYSRTFSEGGEHTLRLVADTSHDVIDLDFLGVIRTAAEDAPPEYGNLYYLAIIPAVLLIVFVICVCMDIAQKRKRRARRSAPPVDNGSDKTQ